MEWYLDEVRIKEHKTGLSVEYLRDEYIKITLRTVVSD